MFKTTILAALMASSANAQYDTYATCRQCIADGGRQCLTSAGGVTFYDTGTCCASSATSIFCTKSYGQKAFNYCAEKSKITNVSIQNWTCPQKEDKCPAQKDVLITASADGEWTVKDFTWGKDQPTPVAEAADWNCKYQVITEKKTGYLVVQTEQYGFDETVTVMGQPKLNPLVPAKTYLADVVGDQNPVYQAKFSQKFYIDASKYDVLVSFYPNAVYDTNPIKENYMGKFRIRTKWFSGTPTAEQLANKPTATENASEAGKEATNWDNEVVPEGKWYDRQAFTIGDFEVTFFGLAVGAGGLAVIIIIFSLICCFISYRKRDAIADGARRASSAVRRGSERVRQSFSGKKGGEEAAVSPDTFYSNDKPINDVHKDMLQNMDDANDNNKKAEE